VSPSRAYGDGIDLMASLRQRFSLPAILVTGHDPARARDQLGARNLKPLPPVLHKPLRAEELLDAVHQLLRDAAVAPPSAGRAS
jgi:CheY-like chemotaxis protein